MVKVFKRDGGKYYYFRFVDDLGKDRWVSTKLMNKRKAQEYAVKYLDDYRSKGVLPKKQHVIPFKEMCKLIEQDYTTNKRRSYERLKSSIKCLEPFFKKYAAQDITPSLVKRYTNKRLKAGMSASSINNELSALRRMFSLMIEQELITTAPVIKTLKTDNVRKSFLEHNEFLSLVQVLPEYLKGPAQLAYYRAMRKGEIFSLKQEDVDLKAKVIRIKTSKNYKGRTIPLNKMLMLVVIGALKRNLTFGKAKQTDPLFLNPKGTGPIKNCRKAWLKACKDAGLEDVRFHDLRRCGVRLMSRSGIPDVVAMSISGHTTRSIYDRYNITSVQDLLNAAKLMDDHLEEMNAKTERREG